MLMRSMSSTPIVTILNAMARSRIRAASTSRRSGVSTLESASPLMRRAGSRITAATTTGPANGPRPASSTPAIRSLMYGLQVLKNVILVGIEHALVLAVQIHAVTALAQQRIGLEENILGHAGDVQYQRAGKADVERGIRVFMCRFVVAFEHVIRDVVRIGHFF